MSLLRLIAKIFSRPTSVPSESIPIAESSDLPPLAYVEWSAVESVCPKARRLEKMIWLPEINHTPPLPECNQPEQCTCMLTYVLEEEHGALETKRLLQEAGGQALRRDIEKQADAKRKAKNKQQDEIGDTVTRAGALEKEDPAQAIDLYQKSIEETLELSETDRFALRDVAYLLNRLSLLLEREKHWEEGLNVIEQYEELALKHATKAQRESLVKRKIRLQKRLQNSP